MKDWYTLTDISNTIEASWREKSFLYLYTLGHMKIDDKSPEHTPIGFKKYSTYSTVDASRCCTYTVN